MSKGSDFIFRKWDWLLVQGNWVQRQHREARIVQDLACNKRQTLSESIHRVD